MAERESIELTPSHIAIENSFQKVRDLYYQGYDPESDLAEFWRLKGINPDDEWLSRRSERRCAHASGFVVSDLLTNYPDLFTKYAMLRGFSEDNTVFHFTTDQVDWHVYFLALGIDQQWYAGSPANHNPFASDGGMLQRVLTSKNLRNVLSNIELLDGGVWPHATHIEHGLGVGYINPDQIPGTDFTQIMTFQSANHMRSPYIYEPYPNNFLDEFDPEVMPPMSVLESIYKN